MASNGNTPTDAGNVSSEEAHDNFVDPEDCLNGSDLNDDSNDANYEPDHNVTVAPRESGVQTRSRGNKNNIGFSNYALLTAEPMNVNEIESRPDKQEWLDAQSHW